MGADWPPEIVGGLPAKIGYAVVFVPVVSFWYLFRTSGEEAFLWGSLYLAVGATLMLQWDREERRRDRPLRIRKPLVYLFVYPWLASPAAAVYFLAIDPMFGRAIPTLVLYANVIFSLLLASAWAFEEVESTRG